MYKLRRPDPHLSLMALLFIGEGLLATAWALHFERGWLLGLVLGGAMFTAAAWSLLAAFNVLPDPRGPKA